MKTKPEKTFDAVAFMREQRRRISEELSKMTTEEILAYFEQLRKDRQLRASA